MNLFSERRFTRWIILAVSVVLIGLFLWNISIFFDRIKKEERKKMEIWVEAYSNIINNDLEDNVDPLSLTVIERNSSTPMIEFDVDKETYKTRNISDRNLETKAEIQDLIETYKSQNTPIKVTHEGELLSIIYYGNSDVLQKLKYFPVVIIVAIMLFILVMYYFYITSKSNEQNKLWAGMAKETAHQIGTPLSSLVGWTELLKTTEVKKSYIGEMEKDIYRLQTITERFSKIGSTPTLREVDFVQLTTESFEYLKSRSSKLVELSLNKPDKTIKVALNEELFGWCVENLVKNATDATKGRGQIDLEIKEAQKHVYLYVSDTGKGLPSNKYKRIFKPGYTSKKRGWGLGLSLAKRIIEDYHEGRIKVLKSEIGKGTTFEIRLQKA